MQEEAFRLVKAELCKPTVLAFYTSDAPTKLSADASSHAWAGRSAATENKGVNGIRITIYVRYRKTVCTD